jgi:uncharacterized lipoprotein YddW (UPF0748 family)
VAKDGSVKNEISYAYPKVREYIMNVLKEVASVNLVDGVNIDFCRYPYVFGYEPVLTDAYKAQYGIDPKNETTPDGLNRWYQFRADIMTQFMREIRQELAGKVISVRIPYKDPQSYGLDIQTWVKEGLIDRLIPSVMSYEDFYDILPYVRLVKGTKVSLYAGITSDLQGHDLTKEQERLMRQGLYVSDSKYLTPQQYLLRAHEVYQAGADGVFLFNTKDLPEALRILGDRIKVDKWHEFQYPAELVYNKIVLNE